MSDEPGLSPPFADPEDQDPDQAWFWTPEWQAGEREVDIDLATGHSTVFSTVEAFDAFAREIVADDGEHLSRSA